MKQRDSPWSDVSMSALIQVDDILSMGFELLFAKQLETNSSETGNM